ncbi:MAG: Eco57I restriction-modification methylase domain-containing protein [Candidatus Cloacimonetes bacterium]|nr:Eco57I restriction-modification methylase domain-containing protein [Candidatus Cloacimonadota bacterium]
MKVKDIHDELPSQFADRIGYAYTSKIDKDMKKENGQYFTPYKIADFMSSFSNKINQKELNILDPGCGTGTLSCSLIEYLLRNNKSLIEINLTCYEIDSELIDITKQVLIYLENWIKLVNSKLIFKWELRESDFVIDNQFTFLENSLFHGNKVQKQFDLIISNPPYFKISKSDKRAKIAESIVYGQPNIYSIFMMLSAKLLSKNGEMIFIIPRSFASGPYFRLFREIFFNSILLTKIHIFKSRKKAFKRDDVLQENIIIKAIKKNKSKDDEVTVSISESSEDLNDATTSRYFFDELVNMKSKQKILYIPLSQKDETIIRIFNKWQNNLEKNFIKISTGPVVAFRKKDYLCDSSESSNKKYSPLLWLTNTQPMKLVFPGSRNKKHYIEDCSITQNVLVKNRNYVLLRRFSTKDDKSRLIAAPYFAENFKQLKIGIENHLNYIYKYNGELSKSEVMGLAALFNSSLFDLYFRTFNGNTQVSVTELKEIPLPPMEKIEAIGFELLNSKEFSQENIDSVINKLILH